MGITSCTISGTSYLVNATPWQPFIASDILEMPGALTVTIEDPAGTYNFTRGEKVQLIDSIDGVKYSGFVLSSRPSKLSPGSTSTYIEHTLTCTDKTYPLTKLPNTTNYEEWYAGDVAVDMVVNGSLAGEGISVAANLRHDTTDSDFNTGILSGTIGDLNDSGDGCLELAKAGSDLSISENTTANFSTGTLTNVQAINNTLTPVTQNAIQLQASLGVSIGSDTVSVQIWSGSMTVGTSDSLHYEMWVDGSSPQKTFGIDLGFSDGTYLHTSTTSVDTNGQPATPATDLSAYANNQWYSRTIALDSSINGKIINNVMVCCGGTSSGTYRAWFKNIYLVSSGSPFFSTSANVTTTNPPKIIASQSTYTYPYYLVTTTIVAVFDPANTYRISSAYSIDAIKLLGTSLVTWNAVTPGNSEFSLSLSYDGGSSYQSCVNNGTLVALPPGSNVAGLSLLLKEVFTSTDTTPTTIPTLVSLNIALTSAPNPTSAKSDIVTRYVTQANWNSGTLTNLVAQSNGDLTIATNSRNWNDGVFSNQTFTQLSGSSSQGVSSGRYYIQNNASSEAISCFDFVGQVSDFIFDIDVTLASSTNTYLWYRASSKSEGNPFYFVVFDAAGAAVSIYAHLNSTTSTQIATFAFAHGGGSTVHIKIDVRGTKHQVFLGGSTSPQLSATDTMYTGAGYLGVDAFSTGSGTTTYFDNFTLSTPVSGTWQSTSVSLSSLGTCGTSIVNWVEVNTANPANSFIQVQTSIDGGSTFQVCSNGSAIPNLPSGTNVSGKNLITKILVSNIYQPLSPIIRQLVWRVLGAYPGSSGTRSTKPLGIDYVDRANQSGFGTASNGQVWAKTGTGTDAVNTNKLTITNTTGDVHERAGTRTGSDLDGTVQFSLSASSETGGMELRHIDANNYYRLAASTTALSIIKKSNGVTTTLKTVSVTLSTGTLYYLRFRVTGFAPTSLYGRVWASGTLEPTNWTATITD